MADMAASPNPQTSNEPVIEVRDLCNRFGDHIVHEDLDLDLLRGEILGVVGGSGTGKTVLLRIFFGDMKGITGIVCCMDNPIWPFFGKR